MRPTRSLLAILAIFLGATSALAAGDTVYGFQWTKGTAVITPSLMGIANDGKDKAGVDQTVFFDGNGNLRLMFAGPNNTKHSAISSDNGTTWREDKSFTWPKFSIDSGPGAYVAVSSAPEGGYRAYVSFGEKGIASAYSKDGQVWSAEAGARLLPSDFGLQKITSSNPIKLSDGSYRMYIGDDSDYFRNCAQNPSINTNIYSAVSKDQLKWTVEPGVRIGSNVTKLCKLHPQAFVDNDGKYGVVYSVTVVPGPGSPAGYMTACFESKSGDGLNFDSGALVPVGLNGNTALSANQLNCSDPSMFIMPDKTARFFYALFGPLPEGDQIIMSIGTPAGNGNSGQGNSNASSTSSSSPSPMVSPAVTQSASPTPTPMATIAVIPVTSASPKPIASATTTAKAKSITITCVKGKLTTKVTGTNPKCPTGYTKK